MPQDNPSSQEDQRETEKVFLRSQPVELYKILKFEGLANSGAEAKRLVDEGLVSVNGETEFRRRRKIVDRDLIELEGRRLQVVADGTGDSQ